MKGVFRSTFVSSGAESNLLLFPAEMPTPAASSPRSRRDSSHRSDPSQVCTVSLTEVLAEWRQLVRRIGRRHRVLEALLAAGQPVRMLEGTLVVGFSPQHLFHKELLDLPEYRTLTEQEISKTFGVMLKLTTTLSPERGRPRRGGGFGPTPA